MTGSYGRPMRPPPRRRRPPVNPLVAIVLVTLLPAAALFGLWRFADARRDTGPPVVLPPTTVAGEAAAATPPLETPLLSFRRVPGLVARDLGIDEFTTAVNSFGTTLNATSCMVVHADGVPIADHNPDVPVIPASNQKLFTGAAALHVLGTDHTFTTEVRAAAVADGTVNGDLYLVGGGDPLLVTPDWDGSVSGYVTTEHSTQIDALADAIVAAGVTSITGGILGDDSRYDDEYFYDEWGDAIRISEAGPISALFVNDGRLHDGDGWVFANTPTGGAAYELTRLLRQRGVTVGGDPGTATAPADAEAVAAIESQPVPEVVAQMMVTSDNNTAEVLLKEIGLAVSGTGSREAGAAAVTAALDELGIDMTNVVVADGSGLSNDNRVTCHALNQLLLQHVPGDDLASGLPVAGVSGTLQNVEAFIDTPLEGVLAAKTGSLGNLPNNVDPPSVRALAGYVPLESGGTIQFSLVLNSPDQNVTQIEVNRPIWTAFANALATYPTAQLAADIGPVVPGGQ